MENTDFIRLYDDAQKVRDTVVREAIANSIASAAATKSAMATLRSSPPLKKGVKDSHNEVRRLQIALALRGADIKVDGEFGKGTGTALADFQKTSGLNPTGEADPLTWQYLDGSYNGMSHALANQAVDAAETLGKHVEKCLSKGELTVEASHAIAAEAAAAEAIAAEALQAAEPLSAEPFAAEPLGAEPFGAEPLGAEPFGAEPLGAEPLGAEAIISEATNADPLGTAFNNFRSSVANTQTDKP